jgi:pyruvate kinase
MYTTEVHELHEEVAQLIQDAEDFAAEGRQFAAATHFEHRDSADNLLHYLAFRRRDVRHLQERLARLGLSSLGRLEADVLPALRAVRHALQALAGQSPSEQEHRRTAVASGSEVLARNTERLLGTTPPQRSTRIMVTMPSEAADDPTLIRQLVAAGMDCLRINCAHDGPAAWERMIEHLRRAEQETGKSCRACMDLAGPKLRTGPLESLPGVFRFRPRRDALGRVLEPARIHLTANPSESAGEAPLAVPRTWLARIKRGDEILLCDARGASRRWKVATASVAECIAESEKTCYVTSDTKLQLYSSAGRPRGKKVRVGSLPPREGVLLLSEGDRLILRRDGSPGRDAIRRDGRVIAPAAIGCALPEALSAVRVDERILFDDGRIATVVEQLHDDALVLRVTRAEPGGSKLRSDRGVNLPDSEVRVSAFTPKDREDLRFIAQHADMVALSFVSSAAEIRHVRQALAESGSRRVAIVLKIETRCGFENLPELLLEALRDEACGVMIARGDLAVECGFERLAEVQEEILWICEAARVPAIWATQVLENLAKQGLPSRAEITDAAMGRRAECVMLNKGSHILEAVASLHDILCRMQSHQSKKRSMLRNLRLAHDAFARTT